MFATILGRRSVLPDRVEPPLGSPSVGVLPPLTLVLGGARSGKSRHAETLIEAAAPAALYLATAQALDGEMAERVRRHRARRGARWTTREEPVDLAAALSEVTRPERPVLVDCLTLWLSNLLLAGRDVDEGIAVLLAVLPLLGGPAVFVANEVGLGIVPDNALARAFRDHAGRLNQAVAAQAQRVVFLAAGLPLTLKDVA
jgi:adenosylcobinamide kinase/adenosylcobinamide-phosphate guanylyltransferase